MDKRILFPDEKIIETSLFRVRQDWEVPIPGFFIIAPIRNIRCIDEFSDDEASEFIGLVRNIRKGMREVLGINDVYLFQNEDTSGRLFHLWMFPRYPWMEEFGRKIQSVRPIMDYAERNMTNEQAIQEVKNYARRMREYMSQYKH